MRPACCHVCVSSPASRLCGLYRLSKVTVLSISSGPSGWRHTLPCHTFLGVAVVLATLSVLCFICASGTTADPAQLSSGLDSRLCSSVAGRFFGSGGSGRGRKLCLACCLCCGVLACPPAHQQAGFQTAHTPSKQHQGDVASCQQLLRVLTKPPSTYPQTPWLPAC